MASGKSVDFSPYTIPPLPARDTSGPVSSFRAGRHGRDSGGGGGGPRRGGGGGGVPDYLLHPERWTCYSLEDVPDSSDADNRAAAHQYLSGLQRRKERYATLIHSSTNIP